MQINNELHNPVHARAKFVELWSIFREEESNKIHVVLNIDRFHEYNILMSITNFGTSLG